MILRLSQEVSFNTKDPRVVADGLRFGIVGESGSGKSTAAALIAGQWILGGGQVVVLDAHREYASLACLKPSMMSLVGYRPNDLPLGVEHVQTYLSHLDEGKSLCFDLSEWTDVEPAMLDEFVFKFIKDLYAYKKKHSSKPVLLVVDEAAQFASQIKAFGESAKVRTFVGVGTGGRKFNLHMVVGTQRPALVDKSVLSSCNVKIFLRVTDFKDFQTIKPYLPTEERKFERVKRYDSGEAVLVSRWLDEPIRTRLLPPPVSPSRDVSDFLLG